MLGPKSIFDAVKDRKVVIHTVSFGTATGVGKDHTGVVISYSLNLHSELFLILDTGEIINTKYIVSIDILE